MVPHKGSTLKPTYYKTGALSNEQQLCSNNCVATTVYSFYIPDNHKIPGLRLDRSNSEVLILA